MVPIMMAWRAPTLAGGIVVFMFYVLLAGYCWDIGFDYWWVVAIALLIPGTVAIVGGFMYYVVHDNKK